MRKLFLILAVGLFFSCAAVPPVSDEFSLPGEDGGIEAAGDEGGDLFEEETPEVEAPPVEPAAGVADGELTEPSADVPETADLLAPPGEAADPVLPEPDAPALIEVPEPSPPLEPPPLPAEPPAPPPREPEPEAQPEPQAPPEPPREPPAPPPFLRIPEPVAPPPERTPVPVPINPVPDPPVWTPPPALPEEDLVFSRVVRATVGQLVEIPFRGTGWVYLGELGSRRGIAYDSRRLDSEGQSFVFRTEAPGIYVLKFYKQDFIRDYILNDHVQVIVGEAPESAGIGLFNPPIDRGRVIAEPRWPPPGGPLSAETASPEPPSASRDLPAGDRAATSAEAPVRVSPPAALLPETPAEPISIEAPEFPAEPISVEAPVRDSPPDDYIRRAREEFDAGRIGQALAILDQFRQIYPSGTDEAWWLYGQLLEANSPARDIRLALEYYRRLIREFPQSPRVPEAQRRIAYLERYYFNIQ